MALLKYGIVKDFESDKKAKAADPLKLIPFIQEKKGETSPISKYDLAIFGNPLFKLAAIIG